MMRLIALLLLLCFTYPACAQSIAPSRSIAITFDDLPGVIHDKGSNIAALTSLNQRILAALKKHNAPAIGFVIEKRVQANDPHRLRVGILELWPKSGMSLGNHTYSHFSLNQVPAGVFERDAYADEADIRPLMQKYRQNLKFFRYPYNQLGETAEKKAEVLRFLSEHHYEIATCTVENFDWLFDVVYHNALANNDSAAAQRIRDAYLKTTEDSLAFYEKRSRLVLGREIPQVLLLHANQLNAEFLDDVLTLLERRGYSFKSLEEVQSDPSYQTPDDYVGPEGRMWTERWAIARKIKPDSAAAPKPPTWIRSEYQRLAH